MKRSILAVLVVALIAAAASRAQANPRSTVAPIGAGTAVSPLSGPLGGSLNDLGLTQPLTATKKRVLLVGLGQREEKGAIVLYKIHMSGAKSFMNVIVANADSKAAITALLSAIEYDGLAAKAGDRDERAMSVYTVDEEISHMRGPDIEQRAQALRDDLKGHLAVVKSFISDGEDKDK